MFVILGTGSKIISTSSRQQINSKREMLYAIIRILMTIYMYNLKSWEKKRISSLNREKQYSYKKRVRLKCIGKAKEHGLEWFLP